MDMARKRTTAIRHQRQLQDRTALQRWTTISKRPPPLRDQVAYNKWQMEKAQLRAIYTKSVSAASKRRIQARQDRWTEQGERPTRYFYRMVKARQLYSYMERIQQPDGSITNNISDMLGAAHDFYAHLYSRGQTNIYAQSVLLSELRAQLSEDRTLELNAPTSKKEILNIIQHLARWKAPGMDGFRQSFTVPSVILLHLSSKECSLNA